MTDNWLAIVQAIPQWMAPQLGSLGLQRCIVDRSARPHPRYPANALTDMPAIYVRPYTEMINAVVGGGAKFGPMKASVWYYRRQTPGQNHVELLMADVKTILELWLGHYNPAPVKMAGAEKITPEEMVVHDELDHPLGEPGLRVSVAEITLSARAQGYSQ